MQRISKKPQSMKIRDYIAQVEENNYLPFFPRNNPETEINLLTQFQTVRRNYSRLCGILRTSTALIGRGRPDSPKKQ